MKILIAEDTEDARIILRTTLKSEGYDVSDAPNGTVALKMAKEDPPDMIISDIMMPEMDGFTFCRECKKDRILRMIPFIFYTATYTDPKEERLAMSLGASRFILKPIENDEFLRIIEEVINEHKERKLLVPRMSLEDDDVLNKMHEESLERKLEKKVKLLEKEIVERKKAEKEIKQFSRIFEDSLNEIYMFTEDTLKFRQVNSAAQQNLGYSMKEFLNLTPLDLKPKFTYEAFAKLLAPLRKGEKKKIVFETIHKRKDQSLYDVEVHLQLLEYENETLFAAIILDITERKKADKYLKESEEKFRIIFNNTTDGILIADIEEKKFFMANNTICSLLGYTREEIIGLSIKDIHPKADLPYIIEQFERQARGESNIGEDLPVMRKDGTVFYVDIRTRPIVLSGKKYLVGVFNDITERKKADIALNEAFNEISRLKEQLEAENIYLREEVKLQHEHGVIAGESDAIKETLKLVEQVAGTDSTVLILGETGTGKELVAQSIHDLSKRKHRPMVKVNCAAIPSTLIESELFGREKGAYTGAMTTQVGRFEVANGSSLFLDEIGELSSELQAKLLRVIQDGSLERLGSTKTIKVDVRIIAATNRNLEQAMVDGKFRSDLYYRLNVFPVSVPPLRERREDIEPLVRSFITEFEKMMGKQIKSIPRKDVQALQSYSWPGNVRELRNLVERSMILTKDSTLHIENPKMSGSGRSLSRTLDEIQKDHILSVLEHTNWRVRGESGAAEILGLKPTTLDSRMKRLGIKRQDKNS